jgi:hypothetical protein
LWRKARIIAQEKVMQCFVIMPFQASFDPVFEAVKTVACNAILDTTFECYWLKDVHAAGRITDDILRGLNDAAFCIADLTGHNPNVMWETGYAMALGKPTILIGQDVESLPFDLRSHRVLAYSPQALPDFHERLRKAIQDTLARYELKGTHVPDPPASTQAKQLTIAVTGTMHANEAAVCHRIKSLLTPYLSDTTLWLVGAVGTVDVAAIRFLLEHGQRVSAVGYHRFDCVPELRPEIDAGRLSFLDGSVEAIPRGMKGPSQRDIIFCIKSDLVILFWDGESEGTKDLVTYYRDQGVSTLLAYI